MCKTNNGSTVYYGALTASSDDYSVWNKWCSLVSLSYYYNWIIKQVSELSNVNNLLLILICFITVQHSVIDNFVLHLSENYFKIYIMI